MRKFHTASRVFWWKQIRTENVDTTKSSAIVSYIITAWPTNLFASHNFILVHICRPSDCIRKTIMPLVRRPDGRRHHWTSLTAFVSKAALSKALDVRAERCSPPRGNTGRNGCAFQESWANRRKLHLITRLINRLICWLIHSLTALTSRTFERTFSSVHICFLVSLLYFCFFFGSCSRLTQLLSAC